MSKDEFDLQCDLSVNEGTLKSAEEAAQNDLRELQLFEYDILKNFVAICTRNRLQYFLAEGTLLGAVRHHGFIPWDDDVDVCMPRGDFEKFTEIAPSEIPDGYTCCLQNDTGIWGTLRIADTNHKICRKLNEQELELFVSVDVFPLDGFPKNSFEQKFHWLSIFFQYCMFRYARIERIDRKKKRGLCSRLAIMLASAIPVGKLLDEQTELRHLTDVLKKYSFSNSEAVINFYSEYGKKTVAVPKTVMPKSFFGDGKVTMFESEEFCIPSMAEKILEKEYGDYMTPPPLEERKAKHSIKLIK